MRDRRFSSWRPRGPLWRNRDFVCLWSAQSVGKLGSQVTTEDAETHTEQAAV